MTITDAEIEAAAQAIRSKINGPKQRIAWGELPTLVRERYRDEARAAIAAYLRIRAANHRE